MATTHLLIFTHNGLRTVCEPHRDGALLLEPPDVVDVAAPAEDDRIVRLDAARPAPVPRHRAPRSA